MSHWSKKQNAARPNSPAPAHEGTVWQLPCGQSLAEFALRTGIVAPKLLATPRPSQRSSSTPGGKIDNLPVRDVPEQNLSDHDSDHDRHPDEALS
jgi:hypothetical protein